MSIFRPGFAGLALSLAMAAPVLAQTAPTDGPARPAGGHGRAAFLASYDSDRDGQVTRAEYDAIRDQRFKAGDTNGDGFMTEEEYVAEYAGRLRAQYAAEHQPSDEAFERQLKQASVRFYAIDRDRDGKISAEENRAVAQRTFESQDTNGDSVVSAADPERPRETEDGRAPAPAPAPAA